MEIEDRGWERDRGGGVTVGGGCNRFGDVFLEDNYFHYESVQVSLPRTAMPRSSSFLLLLSFVHSFIPPFFFRVNYDVNAMHHSLYGVYILLPAWQ